MAASFAVQTPDVGILVAVQLLVACEDDRANRTAAGRSVHTEDIYELRSRDQAQQILNHEVESAPKWAPMIRLVIWSVTYLLDAHDVRGQDDKLCVGRQNYLPKEVLHGDGIVECAQPAHRRTGAQMR